MNVAMLTERRKKPTVFGGKRRKNTTTKIDEEEKVHSSKMTSMNECIETQSSGSSQQ